VLTNEKIDCYDVRCNGVLRSVVEVVHIDSAEEPDEIIIYDDEQLLVEQISETSSDYTVLFKVLGVILILLALIGIFLIIYNTT
jgi:hypothetical protein